MKRFYMIAAACLLVIGQTTAQLSLPPSGNNQKSVVRQYMASEWVEIVYNSPDVDGREGKIWGQLVPYGLTNQGFGLSTADNPSPWRAGANQNTTIELSTEMEISGQKVAAGKYGLHMLADESSAWKVILTGENNAWGSYFFEASDKVLEADAQRSENDFVEYLTYEFTNRKNDETTVNLKWENKKVSFAISVPDMNDKILAAVSSELKNSQGFNYLNFVQAANWASGAGFHEEAMNWAEVAISAPFVGQKDFNTLSTKGTVLRNAGKVEEANEVMDEAIKMSGVTAFQIHGYGRQLIAGGQADKALEVFKFNHKQNKGVWPTNYGLARGYSAVGDFKNALKYLKIAKTKVPEGDTQNPPVIEANIKKLEQGEDIN
ncbi:MAG: DUF2911 domain-containing protein [Cyclobacteriaceae bacterium]